jgi:hypothetical protein
MASLEFDPVAKRFRIRFRYNGGTYKRSLKTANPKDAQAVVERVEETIPLLKRGRLEKFGGTDPATGASRSSTEDLGFVLDYGKQGWNDVALAQREFVSNAINRAIRVLAPLALGREFHSRYRSCSIPTVARYCSLRSPSVVSLRTESADRPAACRRISGSR